MFFGIVTLFVALSISGTAAYYSIIGLTAIFAASVLPVVIMGSVLEVGKIVTTVWLHKNWHRASVFMRVYLTTAVAVLMFVTSMGIFGFLSKAHIDQTSSVGDNTIVIERIDKSIERENRRIQSAEDQLDLLDEALARYTELGAVTRGLNAREDQKQERRLLNDEILSAQSQIAVLEDQKLELNKQQLALEAEVGPIKYIAELVYGNNTDKNTLEQAVRWVILILVLVFDPLAVILVLAGTMQLDWASARRTIGKRQLEVLNTARHQLEVLDMKINQYVMLIEELDLVLRDGKESSQKAKLLQEQVEQLNASVELAQKERTSLVEKITELENQEPEVVEKIVEVEVQNDERLKELELVVKSLQIEVDKRDKAVENLAKKYDVVAKRNIEADDAQPNEINAKFGTEFPSDPSAGELFLRVDFLPSRLYKHNGTKWIEVKKENTDTYVYNDEYIEHLIDKLQAGEYDVEDLNDQEREQIQKMLSKSDAIGK